MIVLRSSCCYVYASVWPLFPLISCHSISLPHTHTHAQLLCYGVSVSLFVFHCSPLILPCASLASLFSFCLSVFVSPLCLAPTLSHTQQTHHQPLNFCPAHNAAPHKKYAPIATTVLTHIPHACKHTQRATHCRLNNMITNIHENH